MKKGFTVLILVVICFLLYCLIINNHFLEDENSENSYSNIEQNEKKNLRVYIPINVIYGTSESSSQLYTSKYRIGECWNYKIGDSIYENAISEYKEKSDVDIDIIYFDSQQSMETQVTKDVNAGTLPDVIISDSSATNQIYYYIQNYAVDLKPYLYVDENVEYFDSVQRAFEVNGSQFILPLLFNINAIYTTIDNTDHIGYIGYEDALIMFEESMNQSVFDADITEAVYAVPTGNPTTIAYLLWNSLGASSVLADDRNSYDFESNIYLLLNFMKRYLEYERDFINHTNVELPDRASFIENSYLELYLNSSTVAEATSFYSAYIDQISYWIDGVSACNWPLTSMAIQAQYFNSQIEANNEEFALLPISKENDSEKYNANITYFGFVNRNSGNIDDAVQLLLHLQNYKVDSRYGFSVNKNITRDMLNDLTTTHFEVCNISNNAEIIANIQPLPVELQNQIEHILDHIDSASLPNGTIELEIFYNILEDYVSGSSFDDCYTHLLDLISRTIDAQYDTLQISSHSAVSSDSESISTESDASETEILEKTSIKYQFYPSNLHEYEDKKILRIGFLNYVQIDSAAMETAWVEWNDYLEENDSPYFMQLITCSSEKEFDEELLIAAEEELGFKFDLISCLGVNFSSKERENCFEPLESHFSESLKEMYESVPSEYWNLICENNHVYNLYDNLTFQLFGIYPGEDMDISENLHSTLMNQSDVLQTLNAIYDLYETDQVNEKWYLPDGGITYTQNSTVSVPFYKWMPDTFFDSLVPLVGIDMSEENDQIICLLDSPTFKKITEFYKLIHDKNLDSRDYRDSMYICEAAFLGEDTDIFTLGDVYYNENIELGEQYLCIRKDSLNLEYALEFVNRVTTDSEYAHWFYYGETVQKGFYFTRYRFLNSTVLLGDSEIYTQEYRNHLIEKAVPTPLTGFVFDTASVEKELESIQNYLLKSEVYKRIEESQDWGNLEEDIAVFRAEIYELGIQKIIDEANKQYSKWLEDS